MIRQIQRKLIIPRGDTGTFTIPAISESTVVGVFSLIHPLTRDVVLALQSDVVNGMLTFTFTSEDTSKLEARRYLYDITAYSNPLPEDPDEPIQGIVHSYFSAYKLPICEIRDSTNMTSTNRELTRDRLYCYPPLPRGKIIDGSPWEQIDDETFLSQFEKLLRNAGVIDENSSAAEYFQENSSFQILLFSNKLSFPDISTAQDNKFYYDLQEHVMYYFDPIGQNYLPINANIIEGTTLIGG